jgi:hypothetical protein
MQQINARGTKKVEKARKCLYDGVSFLTGANNKARKCLHDGFSFTGANKQKIEKYFTARSEKFRMNPDSRV